MSATSKGKPKGATAVAHYWRVRRLDALKIAVVWALIVGAGLAAWWLVWAAAVSVLRAVQP
jgi:Ser/Thr protein kinase RdoA (MazF antagonist)